VDVLEQWSNGRNWRLRLIVEPDGSLSVQTKSDSEPWEYCAGGKQCGFCIDSMPVEDEEKAVATEGTIALVSALDSASSNASAPSTFVPTLCVDYEPVTFAATFVGPEPEQEEPEGPALGNYPDRRKTVGEKVGDFFFNLAEWADGWRF